MLIFQFLTVVLIVALDQGTKLWIMNNLEMYDGFPIIENVIHIFRTSNTGAGWSILEGQTLILILIPIIASVAMIYVIATKKIESKIGSWGMTLILAGALGNLIDRAFRAGEVVDMLQFKFIDFPVFNVADISVTVGAILFFVFLIFIYEDKKK